jgi:hypothetical protein
LELKESPIEAIAFGQAESGDIEGALQTLGKIQWSGDNASYNRALVFEYLSYLLVQSGHLEDATRIASMVDESRRSRALKGISLAFVKEGKVDRALEIISSIKQEQSLVDLLQNIAHAQAAQGDSPGVLKWSQKITSPFVKSKVLLGAVRGILDVPIVSCNREKCRLKENVERSWRQVGQKYVRENLRSTIISCLYSVKANREKTRRPLFCRSFRTNVQQYSIGYFNPPSRGPNYFLRPE